MSEAHITHESKKLSRAEVETVCLLRAIGNGGRTPLEVSAWLGWMPDMAQAAKRAVEMAVTLQYVEALRDDTGDPARDVWYFLTPSGRDYCDTKLKQWGISGESGG